MGVLLQGKKMYARPA